MIDYVSQAKRSRVHIEEKPYVNSVAWDPPLFETARCAMPRRCSRCRSSAARPAMGAFRTAPAARSDQPERPDRPDENERTDPSDLCGQMRCPPEEPVAKRYAGSDGS